jgi:hypothetical protein
MHAVPAAPLKGSMMLAWCIGVAVGTNGSSSGNEWQLIYECIV